MGERGSSINVNIGAERGEKKEDYFDITVDAIGDEDLKSTLQALTEQERQELNLALNREGMSFGAFKNCDDNTAVDVALSEWCMAQGDTKKKATKKLVDLLE